MLHSHLVVIGGMSFLLPIGSFRSKVQHISFWVNILRGGKFLHGLALELVGNSERWEQCIATSANFARLPFAHFEVKKWFFDNCCVTSNLERRGESHSPWSC